MRGILITIVASVSIFSCVPRKYNADSPTQDAGELKFKMSGNFNHDSLTPTGLKLFQKSIQWITDQPDNFAMPAHCAINVSAVYENAGFNGSNLSNYSSPLVLDMLRKVKAKGGVFISFSGKSKSNFINVINTQFAGKIPTGAMIAGCENTTCDGEAGSGHIGILGDIDDNGYTQVYQNNWYRPDNEGGQWKKYMISKAHYNRGRPRQWMPTPWMKFIRDATGKVIDVESAYPKLHGIDDLDPFTYFGFIGVPAEIMAEIKKGQVTSGSNVTLTDNLVCTASSADARIIADSPVSVRLPTGGTSLALPFEPVCLDQGVKNGEVQGFFPNPPASKAFIRVSDVKKCKVQDLSVCIDNKGGEQACVKKHCTEAAE